MTDTLGKRHATALAAICLASLMFGLEISSVPTILPALEQVLGADFQQLQWIMNAYTIAVTSVLMATGTLADRYGRKRLFLSSIALFGLASLICGIAQDVHVLIAARALQGASGGAMLITQLAILSFEFQDPAGRGRAFATWGIVFGTGLGFGPAVGGAILAVANWNWVFLAHVPISVVTILLALRGTHESRSAEAGRLDIVGIATLSLGVFALTYFITQGPALGFSSPGALGILAAALLFLIAFIFVETGIAHPMFDFSVFRIRRFSGALLGSAAMNFSFWPFIIYLPIYFSVVHGLDGIRIGLSLLAYTVPTLIFPPVGERLALRFQPSTVIPLGLFAIGTGFLLMWIGNAALGENWFAILPGCVIAGTGLGITNTPVTNTTTGSVPSDRAGMASGIDMSARMISLAVNIALMGLILVWGVVRNLKALASGVEEAALQGLAEHLAAGGDRAAAVHAGLPQNAIHAALAEGFGLVMAYGWIAAWLLGLFSVLVFGRKVGSPQVVAA